MGFPSITGPHDGEAPVNHALPAWDVACGLYMAVGLLAAERHRQRTGEGQSIEVALQDVALATAGNLGYLAEAQLGEPRARLGNHLFGDFGRDFATADGRVMVAILTARHWRDLVEATGLGEVMAALERALGAGFRRAGDRYGHREALGGVLAPGSRPARARRSRTGWRHVRPLVPLPRLRGGGRRLRDEPLMAVLDQPGVGPHLAPGSPLRLGAAAAPCPPPRWASTPTRCCGTSCPRPRGGSRRCGARARSPSAVGRLPHGG